MMFYLRHALARKAVQQELARLGSRRMELTGIPGLRVRFLVDFHPLDGRFQGEAGVSYLVTVGWRSILFDLGYNHRRAVLSPLRHNLHALGLETTRYDGVFISHNHLDHVGGMGSQRSRTPDLDQLPQEGLDDAPIWTPIPMRHPRHVCTDIDRPTELFPGVASTGPIPAHLYFLGMLREQALMVSLAGRGLVLVVGCGHPGIVEMVRLASRITGQRVIAVVGGLHLIATRGRSRTQKYIAANQPPWSVPGIRGVRRIIEQLRELGVEQLAPSAHDSCDAALAIMQDVFGDGYVEVRAGDEVCFQ